MCIRDSIKYMLHLNFPLQQLKCSAFAAVEMIKNHNKHLQRVECILYVTYITYTYQISRPHTPLSLFLRSRQLRLMKCFREKKSGFDLRKCAILQIVYKYTLHLNYPLQQVKCYAFAAVEMVTNHNRHLQIVGCVLYMTYT